MKRKNPSPLSTARAILQGAPVDDDRLRALAQAYLEERETPRLKESDFYAGYLKWGHDDDIRPGTLICLSPVSIPDLWLDDVEGGYQFIYSTGGNGLMRHYRIFRSISEAEVHILTHHLGRDLSRHTLKVRRFI